MDDLEFALHNTAYSMVQAGILNEDACDCEFTSEQVKDMAINFETVMEDAKLSTSQRKKLKGSSFCGPNRSFPVPDCAHYA